jgi:hypothetical protein
MIEKALEMKKTVNEKLVWHLKVSSAQFQSGFRNLNVASELSYLIRELRLKPELPLQTERFRWQIRHLSDLGL